MKQLNIGIIGAGRIGKLHAQSITYAVPAARVYGITDVRTDGLPELKEKFGIEKNLCIHRRHARGRSNRRGARLLLHGYARGYCHPGGQGGEAHLLRKARGPHARKGGGRAQSSRTSGRQIAGGLQPPL